MGTLFRRNVQNQKSDSDENNKGGSVHNKRESRNHIHHQQGLGHKRRRGISGSAKRNERGKDFDRKRDGNGRKRWRDSRRLIFILGAFLGVLLPFSFGAYHVHNSDSDLFDNFVNFDSLKVYLDDWKDVLPQGISSFIDDIQAGNYSTSSLDDLSENFAVGKQLLRDYNIEAKHPVVMVPGVISTGIESWGVIGDDECDSSAHFRKRLWGSFYMLRTMVMDKVCWLKHVMLDPETGLDPPNFTLRAAQGFESTDYFIAGYWIWNKVFQNLGVIGYEPNKMTSAAYDWRLADRKSVV